MQKTLGIARILIFDFVNIELLVVMRVNFRGIVKREREKILNL